jgi:hypothetical protein
VKTYRTTAAARQFEGTRALRYRNDVMAADEIRYWLKILHQDHGWRYRCLGRVLGIGMGKHVVSKIRGNSWIYGGEQLRMSVQLDRIIRGELVPIVTGRRQDAQLCDPPRPLETRRRMRVALGKNGARLEWVAMRPKREGTQLPNFPRVLGVLTCQE